MSNIISRQDYGHYFIPCYNPASFIPQRGRGSTVWDRQGKKYIDLTAGIAVNVLGHCHPLLIQALRHQANLFWHLGNGYTHLPQLNLARMLVERTFADKVFFCNSGAEANEAALKLARKYARDTFGPQKNQIITFTQSFHGRTLFTVTAGGKEEYSAPFAPLPAGILHLPFNDLEAVNAAMSDNICAILVEPIQGEGGVIPAQREFLSGLRQLCNHYQAAFIVDEVQSGVGRTGKLYAYQHYEWQPDLLTTAKGLGGGFPIGALLAKDQWAAAFQPGDHGSTFGGNPLATAVASRVLELIDPVLLAGVEERHDQLICQLQMINQQYPIFQSINGLGLLLGARLAPDYRGQAKRLMQLAAEEGIMTLIAGADVLRLAPALNIRWDELDLACTCLQRAVARFITETRS